MAVLLELDKTLQKIMPVLKMSGVDINSRRTPRNTKRKLRSIYFLNLFWLHSDVAGAIFLFCTGIAQGKSFTELTYIAPCITLSMLCSCKTLSLIYYEDVVCDLLDDLRDLERRCNLEFSTEKLAIAKKEVKFVNRLLRYFNVLNFMLVLTFALSSIVIIAINYMKTKELTLVLPFLITYPFDPFTITRWPFVYLHQVWSESVVVLFMMVSDYLYFMVSTYIKILFDMLQKDFYQLVPAVPGGGQTYDDRFYGRLVELVDRHRILIRSVDRLEVVYGKSTLLNFLSSSVIICLTGFNVTTLYDAALVVTFLSFLSTGLLQIFFLCFYGDMIMKASMGIGDAVYNNQWYTADVKTMKVLNIVQLRAQKPCKLTAFRFADVNCRAFMRILSTSWSYFALLKTLYSPKPN